ncbi:hypothetical protein, partial [Escherichia coli]|uniref:hypothetical protein n=1 Tax=Escherichia coli TaxID=562 RepID=UPI003D803326
PTDVAVWGEEMIEVPKAGNEERFLLQGKQGAGCVFLGEPPCLLYNFQPTRRRGESCFVFFL